MRPPRTTVTPGAAIVAIVTVLSLMRVGVPDVRAQALPANLSSGADPAALADMTPSETTDRPLSDIQTLKAASDETLGSEVAFAVSGASVTNGYGDWYGFHLRGLHHEGNSTFLGEVAELQRFGERTTFGSINYITDFDADWYGAVGFSGTTAGTILPSARFDVSINRKLLPQRSLVLSVGAGYAWNRSDHKDQLYHVGLIWYVVPQWILEAGWNYDIDSPGSIKAPAYYAAVTYGEVGKSLIAVRGGYGREAYQSVGIANQLVDFDSKEASVRWRYWFTRKWSTQLQFEYYHNPFYNRYGGEVSALYQF
jgi:YaiO family outer membrane protein